MHWPDTLDASAATFNGTLQSLSVWTGARLTSVRMPLARAASTALVSSATSSSDRRKTQLSSSFQVAAVQAAGSWMRVKGCTLPCGPLVLRQKGESEARHGRLCQ